MCKKFGDLFVCSLSVGFIALFFFSGCASRTKMTLGPLQIGGQVQVFEESHDFEIILTPNKIGFTLGCFEASIDSSIGPCEKIIGLEHSTGDPEKVFKNSD